MNDISAEDAIRGMVRSAVEAYATGFQGRHEGEHGNPDGVINMKIHNVFIAALGPEIQYYTALVRSLDSSLGNMLEGLAVNIAKLFFDVQRSVNGTLSVEQTNAIAGLLERYKRGTQRPTIDDYQMLRQKPDEAASVVVRHDSDYYLTNKTTGQRFLIELKIGGDLDNKKARSEKEALLEQFAILSNSLPEETPISIHFATAYNRFGEDKDSDADKVLQFVAPQELLVGKRFWNFFCQSDKGADIVLDEFQRAAAPFPLVGDSVRRQIAAWQE